MNTHSHKEPPLRYKVNHITRKKINYGYYISMTFFIVMAAFTFASAV